MESTAQESTEPELQALTKTSDEKKTPSPTVEQVNQLWYQERDPYLA